MFDLGIGGLFTGPVGAVLEIGDDKLKQQGIKGVLSAAYSAVITGLFELGRRKLLGFGAVLQAIARSIYLSLQPMVENKLLSLAVPLDLLDRDEMAKFESEYNTKI